MKYKTIGFLLEVCSFILCGAFFVLERFYLSINFLLVGLALAYVVGKALIKEGVAIQQKDLNTSVLSIQ